MPVAKTFRSLAIDWHPSIVAFVPDAMVNSLASGNRSAPAEEDDSLVAGVLKA